MLGFEPCAGTYGMGGPGFFALRVAAAGARPTEWLICTLWAADNWIIGNGRWLSADPRLYAEKRPWYGSNRNLETEHGVDWDELTPRLAGQSLRSFRCGRRWCEIQLDDLRLEITEAPDTRPIFCGVKKPRAFHWRDDLRKAWVLADRMDIEI